MLVLGIVFSAIVKHVMGKDDSLRYIQYDKLNICPSSSGSGVLVSSPLKCASICTQNTSCRSYSVEKSMPGTCRVRTEVVMDTGCQDDEFRHFKKLDLPCLHGGIYDPVDATCRCFHGYVGERCERLMIDCSEGWTKDYYANMEGIFTIHPPTSPYPFKVWCLMKYGGRTFVMRKETGKPSVDFNRTWEEYKNGFGDMGSGGNFWLGNEHLHYMTNHSSMKLTLEIWIQEGSSSAVSYRQRNYKSFKVKPESDGFSCEYQTSSTNTKDSGIHELGDCLADQKQMEFTTIDNDNDVNADGNCAEIHLSGWWYSDCGGCNPTGRLQPMSDTNQSSDPTYISVPFEGNLVPRSIFLFLYRRIA